MKVQCLSYPKCLECWKAACTFSESGTGHTILGQNENGVPFAPNCSSFQDRSSRALHQVQGPPEPGAGPAWEQRPSLQSWEGGEVSLLLCNGHPRVKQSCRPSDPKVAWAQTSTPNTPSCVLIRVLPPRISSIDDRWKIDRGRVRIV